MIFLTDMMKLLKYVKIVKFKTILNNVNKKFKNNYKIINYNNKNNYFINKLKIQIIKKLQ